MIEIKVIDRDGQEHNLEAQPDDQLMEVLREHEWGVSAICGGMCSCATCHVHVKPEDMSKTGMAGEIETVMLELDDNVDEYSRLSCQLAISDSLDGIVLKVAK